MISEFAMAEYARHRGHVGARQEQMDTALLVDRTRGSSSVRAFVANVASGTSMELHIHPFDQFYLVLDGALGLQIGLTQLTAGARQLVMFPAGVVHRSWNDSGAPAREVTINVPEQAAGVRGAVEVILKQTNA